MYGFNDINGLTKLTDAPVEIQIELRKRKTINFHCGKTELEENERKTGWCATKLDARGMLIYKMYVMKTLYDICLIININSCR